MCPVCLATAAWIAAGVTSTGGLSALAVKTFRGQNEEANTTNKTSEQGERHG
jgi:hypothetical protein